MPETLLSRPKESFDPISEREETADAGVDAIPKKHASSTHDDVGITRRDLASQWHRAEERLGAIRDEKKAMGFDKRHQYLQEKLAALEGGAAAGSGIMQKIKAFFSSFDSSHREISETREQLELLEKLLKEEEDLRGEISAYQGLSRSLAKAALHASEAGSAKVIDINERRKSKKRAAFGA